MGSSSKPKKQIVAYNYYITMHFALSHGTIDRLTGIRYKDKLAWEGSVSTGAETAWFGINNPGLFGGTDSEGGMQGAVEFGRGGFDQEIFNVQEDGTYSGYPPPGAYYQSSYWNGGGGVLTYNIGGGIPFSPSYPRMATHYRGLAICFLHDMYIGTNPYLSDIAFRVERFWKDWYPEVARIGPDANPAHIIYEVCTNDQWGMSYPASSLDDDAFRLAALTLYNENLGLSLAWADQTSVEDFINEILQHIDGDFFFDHTQGKWRLRLVRGTDVSKMDITPENAVMSNFTRRALGEVVNQLYVKYTSPENEEFLSVAVQDLASIESQEQAISSTKEYRGIRNEGLALHVCQRDLQTVSATLATADITVNREGWDLTPGDVVTLVWPQYKINRLRMRVSATEDSDNESGDIALTVLEDVFGRVDSVFGGTNPPGWENGQSKATLFDALLPWELPHWYVAQRGEADPLVGFTTVLAATQNTGFRIADQYNVIEKPDTERQFQFNLSGPSTPSGVLGKAVIPEVWTNIQLDVASMSGLLFIAENSFVVMGSGKDAEICWLTAIGGDGVVTLDRGVLDTHPRAWPIGTRVYFPGEQYLTIDEIARPLGSTRKVAVAMQSQIDVMPVANAQIVTVPTDARQGRPYPPQNIRFNDVLFPEQLDASQGNVIQVTWSNRNRLLQVTEDVLRWDAGNVFPEAGTTVNLTLRQNGTVVAEATGVSGTSYNFYVDGLSSGQMSIEVWTERDGLDSYQSFTHTMDVAVDSAAPSWPAVSFPGTRAVLIGDSITFEATLHVPPNSTPRFETYNFGACGYWAPTMALMNHPLELEPGLQPDYNGRKQGLNLGQAGSRVMNWWSEAYDNQNIGTLDMNPMYVALRNMNAFDVVVLMGGTNDLSFNQTAASILNNLKAAITQLASKGKWVFAMTITPRTRDLLAGYTKLQQDVIRERLLAVNSGLKSWIEDAQPANVFFVDTYNALVGPNGYDPAGMVSADNETGKYTLGNYRADAPGAVMCYDGLHTASAGAQQIAKVLAAVMRTAGIPERVPGELGPLTLGPNLLANPNFNITTTAPEGGISSKLGRAIGLGSAIVDSTHPVGTSHLNNTGRGYAYGQVPDYWFFYRSSNTDDESYSNFNEYAWSGLASEFPLLYEYILDSTWMEGAAKTSVVTVGSRKALKVEFRTPATGNKNEAFVVRTMLPEGQHGPWDDYALGAVVPNNLYFGGDRLAAEAEIHMSNIRGLHSAKMSLDFLSINSTQTGAGDYSSAGAVISGIANSLTFWPPSDFDNVRVHPEDTVMTIRTPAVQVPEPAVGEDSRYARLDFQFACDASQGPASVTLLIFAPSVTKLSAMPAVEPTPDPVGLGYDLGRNLGGINDD